ncbi:alpha/beta hydrolase [Falsibacillus pallidus]|uniref:Putative alpha/beta superfamily hydrolase n=1 Tax=Falsibacillus pallidus TaxID=493781 RepID=A0A370GQG7_9BACI|nr:alpha/beta hydrolase-fold protein [Falsibacillus pallidus]RDI45965.1 putative alpha/beta superfamily hydrolase [Falsibacillus pallidus]
MIEKKNVWIESLNSNRTIWVHLPESYKQNEKEYPVLYMFDGQNLFSHDGGSPEKWEAEKAAEYLSSKIGAEIIIVGVDHGDEERLNEYNPWYLEKHQFGGKGDAYLDFMATELKSFIDRNYMTRKEPKHTAIGGSSLGGYMSLYAAAKYPEIFGKVLAMSNALWHDEGKLKEFIMEKGLHHDLKIYLDTGRLESDDKEFNILTVKQHEELSHLLIEAGMKKENLKVTLDPEGVHNEIHWRKRLPEALCWLFS